MWNNIKITFIIIEVIIVIMFLIIHYKNKSECEKLAVNIWLKYHFYIEILNVWMLDDNFVTIPTWKILHLTSQTQTSSASRGF